MGFGLRVSSSAVELSSLETSLGLETTLGLPRFRGWLVFKAQTFVSLNSRLESNKKEEGTDRDEDNSGVVNGGHHVRGKEEVLAPHRLHYLHPQERAVSYLMLAKSACPHILDRTPVENPGRLPRVSTPLEAAGRRSEAVPPTTRAPRTAFTICIRAKEPFLI